MASNFEILDLQEKIKELERQVKELQKVSISFNMPEKDRENMKNAIFDIIYQSDQTIPTASASAPYLRITWKNKILYIPFYKK